MARTFQQFWESLDADGKKALEQETGVSITYLSHMAYGRKTAGVRIIDKIVKARNDVTVDMIRPDIGHWKNKFA